MKTLTKGESVANAYLNEIGRAPLLSPEQEIDLGRKVQRAQALLRVDRPLTQQERRDAAVGERAERKMVRSNLRLVVNVAKKYYKVTHSMDMMDLVQEGNLGLITAVKRFDPTLGYRFSTFAYWWIRQGITRAILRKDRSVHMPGRIGEMAANWSRKTQMLQEELGRVPTIDELSKAFHVTSNDVLLFMERGAAPTSLDAVVRSGQDTTGSALLDILTADVDGEGPLDVMVKDERLCGITAALEALKPRDRDIIQRRLGLNGYDVHTWSAIGQLHSISRERVRQVYEAATNRLRLQLARAELEHVA